MTNRQSNIIFYSVVSVIVFAIIVNYIRPDFFGNLQKTDVELTINEAMKSGEHNKALTSYHSLIDQRINDSNDNNVETAEMYDEMAALYRQLSNKAEEKNHYLKSLDIKEQLKKVELSSLIKSYDTLGSLAEEESDYEQAQTFYEKSLTIKLGTAESDVDVGLVLGYQKTREEYLRLNNGQTIATFKKLGEIHGLKKELDTAKKYYERALAASQETFGESANETLEIARLLEQLR